MRGMRTIAIATVCVLRPLVAVAAEPSEPASPAAHESSPDETSRAADAPLAGEASGGSAGDPDRGPRLSFDLLASVGGGSVSQSRSEAPDWPGGFTPALGAGVSLRWSVMRLGARLEAMRVIDGANRWAGWVDAMLTVGAKGGPFVFELGLGPGWGTLTVQESGGMAAPEYPPPPPVRWTERGWGVFAEGGAGLGSDTLAVMLRLESGMFDGNSTAMRLGVDAVLSL